MNKNILVLVLMAIVSLPAFAELTVEDTASPDYLKNHGYSNALINATMKSKAQVNGEPLAEPVEKEYYNKPVVKQVRRFMMYIDPSLDDHTFMNDHSINTTPRYDDL